MVSEQTASTFSAEITTQTKTSAEIRDMNMAQGYPSRRPYDAHGEASPGLNGNIATQEKAARARRWGAGGRGGSWAAAGSRPGRARVKAALTLS